MTRVLSLLKRDILREREWQEERVAFRQFSEKVVSTRCASILESTLHYLDNVRDSVHDSLQARESSNLLEPVLEPIALILKMDMTVH